MLDFRDADHDDDQFDLDETRLYCPSCGCAAEVLRMPRPNTWFSANGLAECHHCRRRFEVAIQFEPDPPEPPKQPSPWEWIRELVLRGEDPR